MDDVMEPLADLAGRLAFSGVVRIETADRPPQMSAFGWANRAARLPMTTDTRLGIASATKGLTAVVVLRLVQDGLLALSTPVRSILGSDLPLIDDRVTVEHLLAHRSGIGDYLDEEQDDDINDYLMPVDVRLLDSTPAYLPILDGFAQKSPPGEMFAYCNAGFVVLAVLAERVSGRPFADLIATLVCEPAGMTDTAMLRSDELPAGTALGYLWPDGLRCNIFHLPLVGSGDGGAYSTVGDVASFWSALFGGRLLDAVLVDRMTAPVSAAGEHRRYGLGLWLRESGPSVYLEGYDAGVSFRSVHDATRGLTHTVVSNTSDGAWPISRYLADSLGV